MEVSLKKSFVVGVSRNLPPKKFCGASKLCMRVAVGDVCMYVCMHK